MGGARGRVWGQAGGEPGGARKGARVSCMDSGAGGAAERWDWETEDGDSLR